MRAKWQTVTKDVLFALRRTGSKNVRAVLFIHGFTGHHEETWINKNGASFPLLMHEDSELSDYDLFSFQYRTNAISGTSIKKVAKQLADEIKQRMSRYEQIVLITHSMGGLVAMRYILDEVAAGRDLRVRGLLLYGVPINGSYLVTMAKLAGAVLSFAVPKGGGILSWLIGSHDQVEQLAPASEFVQDLNDEWALRIVNGGHSSEEAKRRALLPVRVVTGEKDLVVKEVSAKGTYGSIDWHPVEFSHINLVKPTGTDDVRYNKAKDFVIQCRPPLERFALLRLREISDKLLDAQKQRYCREWDYVLHLHGGAQYAADDPLLAAGFSPYVVSRCRYRAILPAPTVQVGFSWGANATDTVWEQQPIYVHEILLRDLPDEVQAALSKVIDDVLGRAEKIQSWSTLFPKLELAVLYGGCRHVLTGAEIERGNNLMIRQFSVPKDLADAVQEEVTFDLSFSSYAPKVTKAFTLTFPWLHVGFKGLIVVHDGNKRFSASQFLSGEKALVLKPEYFGHKSELKLQTDDVVLPGTRVEINWQAEQ